MPHEHHGFVPSSAEDTLRRRVKMELRKRMRALRKALPGTACAERSARIVDRLLGLDAIRGARSIALFWPIEERHEVDLRGLDAVLRERGARVAYPAVDPETHAMTFRFVALPDTMQPQGLAFLEPSASDPEVQPGDLDALVVPALAADPAGQRIGYGAGYYDRALPRFAPPAVTIAVVFDFQLLAEIPITEGDVATEWIVTDSRALKAESDPSAG
ncbi:MAG: 5-formyltetrahydrofolate cyclo-ligase [Myxococcota bacterium]|nr:5-formyltetrahydrofolate cyclo-ligase [Myxococcota bacterium]